MKKTYEKPQIMFESFTLSTNIAGDCEIKTWLPSNTSCGMEFSDGTTIFLDTMNGCSAENGGIPVVSEDGDGEWNGICYHVPFGENLFNS